MLRGIDVSVNQGVVDWPSVAALGCRFCIAKCSEGNKPNADAQFSRNVTEARAAGLYVGAYAFAYPLPHLDPSEQARHAYDLAHGLGSAEGEMPPSFDFEWPAPQDWVKWNCNAAQLRDWALRYLDAATTLWGRKPLLYTYPDFWNHVGGVSEPAFAQYPLWMASYPLPAAWPVDGHKPLIVRPWTDWTVWQFVGGAMRLPNGTPADFDVFNGDEDALKVLCSVGDAHVGETVDPAAGGVVPNA